MKITPFEREWIIYTCSSYNHRRGALYITRIGMFSPDINEAKGYRLKRDAARVSGNYIVMRRSDVRKLPD